MPVVLPETPVESRTEPVSVSIVTHRGASLDAWVASLSEGELIPEHAGASPLWLQVLREALGHETYLLEARGEGRYLGRLPLALVSSALFGRYLVSLPYINTAGLHGATRQAETMLIDQAVALAEQLNVRNLELRHERQVDHEDLSETRSDKVLMRLALPATEEQLWNGFKSKLRSQIRSGEKHGFAVNWGGEGLLEDFYSAFSRNMRDLGTPVFPKRLFASVLSRFGSAAELCVLRLEQAPVAAALLIHGNGVTEVPSASSLRKYNNTNANMVMYWQLLKRAVERGQHTFDFGRSTLDSNTYKFKKQWGAEPSPSVWQYYVRRGTIGDMRPESAKFRLAIRAWQRLPLPIANWLGPMIVRGIP